MLSFSLFLIYIHVRSSKIYLQLGIPLLV